MHDYRLMEPPPDEKPKLCPCCGSDALVWEYIESPDAYVHRVVMCNNRDSIGPRDSLAHNGCLLCMPPQDFYCDTGRAAVRYWNEYAKALTALRIKNNWKVAQVLRGQIDPDDSKEDNDRS